MLAHKTIFIFVAIRTTVKYFGPLGECEHQDLFTLTGTTMPGGRPHMYKQEEAQEKFHQAWLFEI